MSPSLNLLVTGASGQLGRLVINALLKTTPAAQIHALVRSEAAGASLAKLGVQIRIGDYGQPHTLDAALADIDRMLLVSSNELGQRAAQHRNVIDAAVRAGIGLFVYTSVLHADRSTLALAVEHQQTEAALRESGIPSVLLRNGWYTENYTAGIAAALAHGAMSGSTGEGRIASAARADYADAAATVLTAVDGHAGQIYELAGDHAYTLAQFAKELSTQVHRTIAYKDLPEAEFKAVLLKAGLPMLVAQLLADTAAGAAKGALFDDSGTLRKLIGRPTTPYSSTIAAALAG